MARFGHSSNVAVLFGSDNSGEKQDYMLGLMVAGVIIGSFFLMWIALLCAWRCAGDARVGFLSGHPFVIWEPSVRLKRKMKYLSVEHENDDSPDPHPIRVMEQQEALDKRKVQRVRKIFLGACIFFKLFALLFFARGLLRFQSSMIVLEFNSVDLNAIATESFDMVENGLRKVEEVGMIVRSSLMTELGPELCPTNPSLDSSATARSLRDAAASTFSALKQVGKLSESTLDSVGDNIRRVQEGSYQVERVVSDVDVNDWYTAMVMVPYLVVPTLILAACSFAFMGKKFIMYECIVTTFCFPFFFFLTTLAWIFSIFLTFAAGVNADFCISPTTGSPDGTIINILNARGYTPNDSFYQAVQYYASQCRESSDPIIDLKALMPEIEQARSAISALADSLSATETRDTLSLGCGKDFEYVDALVTQMGDVLETMRETLSRSFELLSCSRIAPLYTESIYEGTCQGTQSALMWMFWCSLICGISGMIMVTLRAFYKPTFYRPIERLPEEGNNDLEAYNSGDEGTIDFTAEDSTDPKTDDEDEESTEKEKEKKKKKKKKKDKKKEAEPGDEDGLFADEGSLSPTTEGGIPKMIS